MQHQVSKEESERWQKGNEMEKAFWLGLEEADFQAHAKGYRALAEQLELAVKPAGLPEDFRALQIGCAVEDTIFHMTIGERFAVDPLASFYKANFERSRNPAVDYRQSMGESLPFGDEFFDLVICQNLLDHVANYQVVLQEVRRVLRSPNLIYFGTDVYAEPAARLRWERQERGEVFDPEHPHTFTVETLEASLQEHGFRIGERMPSQPSGKGDDSSRHCLFAVLAD